MTFEEQRRITRWQLANRLRNPVEFRAWDAVLRLRLAGWLGWLPLLAFDAFWAAPLCVLAMFAPTLYAAWRMRAHREGRVRCDWLMAGARIDS